MGQCLGSDHQNPDIYNYYISRYGPMYSDLNTLLKAYPTIYEKMTTYMKRSYKLSCNTCISFMNIVRLNNETIVCDFEKEGIQCLIEYNLFLKMVDEIMTTLHLNPYVITYTPRKNTPSPFIWTIEPASVSFSPIVGVV